MNTKWISYCTLSATLVVGVGLGIGGSYYFNKYHAHHCDIDHKMMRNPISNLSHHFEKRILHIVNPNPEQETKMKPILEKYSSKMVKQLENHHNHFVGMIADLEKDLDTILTEDQMQRLEEKKQKFVSRKMVPPPLGGYPAQAHTVGASDQP